MITKRTGAERIFYFVILGLIATLVILTAYPLIYVVFASLSDPASLMQYRGPLAAPLGFSLAAYRAVFDNPMIGIGYRNTILYVVVGTVLNLGLTVLGAYALYART